MKHEKGGWVRIVEFDRSLIPNRFGQDFESTYKLAIIHNINKLGIVEPRKLDNLEIDEFIICGTTKDGNDVGFRYTIDDMRAIDAKCTTLCGRFDWTPQFSFQEGVGFGTQ